MAIEYKAAISALNKFLWSHSEVTAFLGNTDFTDAPVHPINEQPETGLTLGPGDDIYVIYNYRTTHPREEWWKMQDNISYSIYGTKMASVIKLEKILINILRRYELTAEEINADAPSSSGFNFHYVKFNGSVDLMPQSQEGGVIGRSLLFQVGYTEDDGINLT